MKNIWINLFTNLFIVFVTFVFPFESHSAFYKYIDKEGKIHFVDDLSKIPMEYRDTIEAYKEKHDDLPEEERRIRLEKERKEREILWEREKQESEALRKREQERRKKKEEQEALRKEREEIEKRLITKVTILGNHVIVPVSLGYENNEIEASLVLDTGASTITLYKGKADQLNIGLDETEPVWVMVAGGQLMRGRLAKLDYVRVGPKEKEDIEVMIIPYKGPEMNIDGFLGVNFLRDFDYNVDYGKQVIKWRP